jgi:Cu-Zn family superoxide dismutase
MRHLIGVSVLATIAAVASAAPARAEDITVKMLKATQDGTGEALGTITISDTDAGASFKIALHGLAPGQHGFHVNENDNCGPTFLSGVRIPAGAAGGHYDPDLTGKHAGPLGDGHLGDLPVIEAEKDGTATGTVVAPRIKDIETLKGHALTLQIGGDNYKDTPYLGGGGGGRFACGSIE